MVQVEYITKWKGHDMSRMMHSGFEILSRPARRTGLLARLSAALEMQRSRARLATLDAHLLADIGVDRRTAEAEANRPLWDAPASWIG